MSSSKTALSAKAWDMRVAAARGEDTPISVIGWMRILVRSLALIALLIVFVPLHFAFRIFAYGSPFPMLFLRSAARVCGARVRT
ncbi:MAG: 1-acyl-sn-glycerol-3-phosphate acyltransferase, partial [Pseudomonadota bacterium]